jgi:L-fuculose-phosphate aldolase
MADLADYRKDIVEACAELVRSGIMTRSYHGNVSLRVPNTNTFLLTSGGSLADMRPENVALFELDGTLIEGTVAPVGAEIIQMHAVVYRTRPDTGGVVHTHSPFATGFAVASRSIAPAYEAMVRNGMTEGVPLAKYGPRGSQQSVDNIEVALKAQAGIGAVLLENHGVLAFGASVERAVRANFTVEESAEIMLYAHQLGGATPIPPELIEATRERAASFAAAGTYSAAPRAAT